MPRSARAVSGAPLLAAASEESASFGGAAPLASAVSGVPLLAAASEESGSFGGALSLAWCGCRCNSDALLWLCLVPPMMGPLWLCLSLCSNGCRIASRPSELWCVWQSCSAIFPPAAEAVPCSFNSVPLLAPSDMNLLDNISWEWMSTLPSLS